MMRATPGMLGVALLLALVAPVAGDETKRSTKGRIKGTVKEAARTGGHAARDGALTFGRSARAFVTGGPDAAKKTWRENAARTKRAAKSGARATKNAAR